MVFTIPSDRTVKAILAAVTVTALTLLVLFPRANVSGVWTGYRVLAVVPHDCEASIVTLLDNTRIEGYASESNSLLRSEDTLSPFQPQIAAMNSDRARWFTDGHARFFYLPIDSVRERPLTEGLNALGLSWSLERHERLFFYAYLSLLFAVVCTFLAKNHLLSGMSSVPFVVYALSAGGLPGFASALVALSAVALYGDLLSIPLGLLTMRQILGRIRAHPAYFGIVFLSCAIAITGGAHVFILLLLAVISALSLGALSPFFSDMTISVINARRLHPRFTYLPIHPTTLYRTKGPAPKTIISIATLFILMLSLGFVVRSLAVPKSWNESLKRLSIPTPTGYTVKHGFSVESYQEYMTDKMAKNAEDTLPDLADYIAARWRIAAFPWTSIHSNTSNPFPGDSIGLLDYSQDSMGSIVSTPGTTVTFNDAFVRDALRDQATPLERMLERQGRFITVTRARQDR